MCYELKKPCTDEQRIEFLATYNDNMSLRAVDTDMFLFALEDNEIMGEKEIIIDVPDYEDVELLKDIEVLEYEDVEEEKIITLIDDNDEIILDEDGNAKTTTIKETVRKPIMIDYDVEIEEPVYDEETGEIKEYIKKVVKQQKQKSHIEFEKYIQKVQTGTHEETITIPYPVINPDYEKEKQQKERERIDNLELTGADVERAIYVAKGMDFEDLVNSVKDSELVGFDLKRLKIELKANHFIRKHPYINIVGQILGYTPEDMDYLFETKSLPVKREEEENEESI